jgi:hypothetical protein
VEAAATRGLAQARRRVSHVDPAFRLWAHAAGMDEPQKTERARNYSSPLNNSVFYPTPLAQPPALD